MASPAAQTLDPPWNGGLANTRTALSARDPSHYLESPQERKSRTPQLLL